ncbi:MAG: ROK family protein [Mycobacteriales bacterium]
MQSRPPDPRTAVLDALRMAGPLTRLELSERTGLSRTTVSGLLTELSRRALVGEVEVPVVSTGGRPAAPVALRPAAGLAVGADVGRTHVRVALIDLGHQLLAERSEHLDVEAHPDEALDSAARLVDAVLAESGHRRADLVGVGLGVPAPLDGHGEVGASSILPGWTGHRPATELQQRLGVVVHSENDANLGALAEALWGSGRGQRIVMHVKAATGVGAGIVVDGVLFRGASGTAGELGHTTVREGGDICRCGNRGCLELQVGGPALLAQVRNSGLRVETIEQLIAKALDGDAAGRRVLLDAGDQLGLALVNAVNLLNPDVIVFGGELSSAGELVLAPLKARVQRAAITPAAAAVDVRMATLGNRAEALGAALLVARELHRFDLAGFRARCA